MLRGCRTWRRVRCGPALETPEQCSAGHPLKRRCTDRHPDRGPLAAPSCARNAHVCLPAPRRHRASRSPPALEIQKLRQVEFAARWSAAAACSFPSPSPSPSPSPFPSPSPSPSPSWFFAISLRCRNAASLPVTRSLLPSASSSPPDRRSAAGDWPALVRARSGLEARHRR